MSRKSLKKHLNQEDFPNPFVNSLEIPVKWVLEGPTSYRSYQVDIEQHAKIYPKLMECLIVMSTSGRKVLAYILSRVLNKDFDYLEITPSKVGLGNSSFYRAIEELALMQILRTRKELRKNTYWLNPAMLFRGSRVTKYPERVVSVNEDPLASVKKLRQERQLQELDEIADFRD